MVSINVSLSDALLEYVNKRAEQEEFDSIEDFVLALIEDQYALEHDGIDPDKLHALIKEAEEAGPSIEVTDEYLKEFKMRMTKVIDETASKSRLTS